MERIVHVEPREQLEQDERVPVGCASNVRSSIHESRQRGGAVGLENGIERVKAAINVWGLLGKGLKAI